MDGAGEPELGKSLRLSGPRPEPGAPEETLGLRDPELPPPDGDSHSTKLSTRHDAALIPFGGSDPISNLKLSAASN